MRSHPHVVHYFTLCCGKRKRRTFKTEDEAKAYAQDVAAILIDDQGHDVVPAPLIVIGPREGTEGYVSIISSTLIDEALQHFSEISDALVKTHSNGNGNADA